MFAMAIISFVINYSVIDLEGSALPLLLCNSPTQKTPTIPLGPSVSFLCIQPLVTDISSQASDTENQLYCTLEFTYQQYKGSGLYSPTVDSYKPAGIPYGLYCDVLEAVLKKCHSHRVYPGSNIALLSMGKS